MLSNIFWNKARSPGISTKSRLSRPSSCSLTGSGSTFYLDGSCAVKALACWFLNRTSCSLLSSDRSKIERSRRVFTIERMSSESSNCAIAFSCRRMPRDFLQRHLMKHRFKIQEFFRNPRRPDSSASICVSASVSSNGDGS